MEVHEESWVQTGIAPSSTEQTKVRVKTKVL